MRVISCELKNFASYEDLEFDFNSKGLNLIHGPTGSGKSTLCDAIPWILFGRTAKGGAVDEILSWPGDKVTFGNLELDSGVNVTRIRGPKAKDNDLYYSTAPMQIVRGKDIPDTQKLINNLLKIDIDLYLAGAYFHEFSQTAQFFTTTAKNRRVICEQLVDLSLAKKLQENIGLQNKIVKDTLSARQSNITSAEIQAKTLSHIYEKEIKRSDAWLESQVKREEILVSRMQSFNEDKNNQIMAVKIKIDNIKIDKIRDFKDLLIHLKNDLPPELEPCKECGVPKSNPQRDIRLKEIQFIEKCQLENDNSLKDIANLKEKLDGVEALANTYEEQVTDLKKEENPYYQTLTDLLQEIQDNKAETEILIKDEQELLVKQADLDILLDAVQEFRSILISNTISEVESNANLLLSNHFDSEIKVEFTIEDADKVEATIYKDGNVCSFTQLSKGQRQILKLCFGVSVMKSVANHHGINFNQIFLDESMDGLDDNIKMKTIQMLETLTLDYGSIYLVEHSETVKAFVNNKYKVSLTENGSIVECQS